MIVERENGWWRGLLKRLIRGDRPPPGPPTTRDQLVEARDRLQHQIDVLNGGPAIYRDQTPQTPLLIADLEAALGEVEAELQELDRFSPPSVQPPPSRP